MCHPELFISALHRFFRLQQHTIKELRKLAISFERSFRPNFIDFHFEFALYQLLQLYRN